MHRGWTPSSNPISHLPFEKPGCTVGFDKLISVYLLPPGSEDALGLSGAPNALYIMLLPCNSPSPCQCHGTNDKARPSGPLQILYSYGDPHPLRGDSVH